MYILIIKLELLPKLTPKGSLLFLKPEEGKRQREIMSFIFSNNGPQSLLISLLRGSLAKLWIPLGRAAWWDRTFPAPPRGAGRRILGWFPGLFALGTSQARFGFCSPVIPAICGDVSNCWSGNKVETSWSIWEISFRQNVRPSSPV